METPVEIDYQNMTPGLTLQGFIEEHVAQLETKFGRITACRVVMKGPGDHHRKGGLYEVNIHISLPGGKEVNVSRTPTPDERHSDVKFAISDAFARAKRQMQDHVRRMQGKVKTHADVERQRSPES